MRTHTTHMHKHTRMRARIPTTPLNISLHPASKSDPCWPLAHMPCTHPLLHEVLCEQRLSSGHNASLLANASSCAHIWNPCFGSLCMLHTLAFPAGTKSSVVGCRLPQLTNAPICSCNLSHSNEISRLRKVNHGDSMFSAVGN